MSLFHAAPFESFNLSPDASCYTLILGMGTGGFMKTFSLFVLSLLCLNTSFAAEKPVVNIQCAAFEAPLKGGYCIHKPAQSRNRDIVYYLHGKGNSEKTWQDQFYYPAQIQQFWADHHLPFPTVVSISFGPIWILADKNASPGSGLLSVVSDKIIPTIEASLGGLKGRRIVVGESMGGFNSIQLAFKTKLFDKAGLICSPMATLSPFANQDDVKKFIEASGGWQYYKNSDPDTVNTAVSEMLFLSKGFFPTPEDWKTGNPLDLASQADADSLPTLYIADGFYDKYLSYEATQLFVKTLKERGVRLQWRPQWGGHCSIDIPTLSRFLVD